MAKTAETKSWHSLIFENLSTDSLERLATKKLSDYCSSARQRNKRKLCLQYLETELDTLLLQFNSVELLRSASFWSGISTPASSMFGEGAPLGQSAVELIQSMVLRRSIEPSQYKSIVRWSDLKKTNDFFQSIVESIVGSHGKRNESKISLKDHTTDLLAQLAIAEHLTLRNPGYKYHSDSILIALLSPLDKQYFPKLGYNLSSVLKFFRQLQKLCAKKQLPCFRQCNWLYHKANQGELKKFVNTYIDSRNSNGFISLERMTVSRLRETAIDLAIQNLADITVDKSDILECAQGISEVELFRIVENLSMLPLDTADIDLRSLALDNPASKKPFIKIENDSYLVPNSGALSHNLLESILSDPLIQSTGISDKLREKISKVAEGLVLKRLEEFFPNCVFQNAELKKHPTFGDLESDAVVLQNGLLIVCEVKARKPNSRSEQGDKKTMQQTFSKLVSTPANQCDKLVRAILSTTETITFQTATNKPLTIERNKLDMILSFSVNIAHIGKWVNSAQLIKRSSMVKEEFPPIPNFSIYAFFAILDLLETSERFVHYLQQRQNLEQRITYVADEYDLLGQYFIDRLSLTKLHTDTYDPRGKLYYFGRPLNPAELYFSMQESYLELPASVREAKGKVPKPVHEYSKLWHSLVNHHLRQRELGWSKILYLLLSTPPQIRTEIELELTKITKSIKTVDELEENRIWKFHNLSEELACGIFICPLSRSDVLQKKTNAVIKEVFESDNYIDWLLIIVFDLTGNHLGSAYSNRQNSDSE